MGKADGDLTQRSQLIPASDLPDIFREADRADLASLLVVDDRRGNRHRHPFSPFGLKGRLKVADAPPLLPRSRPHGGHHLLRFLPARIDL